MKNYGKRLAVACLASAFAIGLIAGCGKQDATNTETTKVVSYQSQQYTIPAHPQRIVALSNSVLQMLYAVDGTAVGRVQTMDKLPPALDKLPTVGHTAMINMEELLKLKPDLVLGLTDQHKKFEGQLKSNNLPTILLRYDGINDNIPLLTLLGDITNHQGKAKEVIADYQKKIAKVKESVSKEKPARVAVLRATGKSVTAETANAITASMVQDLGMDNVVAAHLKAGEKSKTVPYALETLATDNPDIIFIVTMGKKDEIAKTMEQEMTSNPAWNNLKAVRDHKVFYLPSNLFLLNPGLETPEAMAMLVKDAYGIDIKFDKQQ